MTKSGTGRARATLRLEGELLDRMRGLPVVQLVAVRESDERTDLVTEDAGAADLGTARGLGPDARMDLLVATAGAVAALHAGGWSHGALCAEHVVVSDGATVSLCSLGSAAPLSTEPTATRSDLEALACTLRAAIDRPDPTWTLSQRSHWRRRGRRIAPLLHAALASSSPRASADLARQLDELRHDRAPAHRRPALRCQPDRPRPAPTALVPVAVVLLLAAVLLVRGGAGPAPRAAAEPGTSGGTPATTAPAGRPAPATPICAVSPSDPSLDADRDGCAEMVHTEGNFVTVGATTYRAGSPGDVVSAAPLSCGGPSVILALRPGTGEVFVFRQLPTAQSWVAAELWGTVPGATAIEVAADPCTRAVLRLHDGDVQALGAGGTAPFAPVGATPTPPPEEDGT